MDIPEALLEAAVLRQLALATDDPDPRVSTAAFAAVTAAHQRERALQMHATSIEPIDVRCTDEEMSRGLASLAEVAGREPGETGQDRDGPNRRFGSLVGVSVEADGRTS